MLLRRKGYGQRDDRFLFLFQGLLKQGVAGLSEAQGPVRRDDRHSGYIIQGDLGLGHQKVHLPDKHGRIEQVGHIGPQEVGEFPQDL